MSPYTNDGIWKIKDVFVFSKYLGIHGRKSDDTLRYAVSSRDRRYATIRFDFKCESDDTLRYDSSSVNSQTLRYDTIQFQIAAHATLRYDAIQKIVSTIRYDTMRFQTSTRRYDTIRYDFSNLPDATIRYDLHSNSRYDTIR